MERDCLEVVVYMEAKPRIVFEVSNKVSLFVTSLYARVYHVPRCDDCAIPGMLFGVGWTLYTNLLAKPCHTKDTTPQVYHFRPQNLKKMKQPNTDAYGLGHQLRVTLYGRHRVKWHLHDREAGDHA